MNKNRFYRWDAYTLSSQLKAQAREQIDPELEMFYFAAAERLIELQDEVIRLHNEKIKIILEKYKSLPKEK